MDNAVSQSSNTTSIQNESDSLHDAQSTLLKVFSLLGGMSGTLLLILVLLNQQSGVDTLLVLSGAVLLLVSIYSFAGKQSHTAVRSQLLLLTVFSLLQVLFIRFGWSGQTLLPWLTFIILSNALGSSRSSRLWGSLGVVTLLIWMVLATANQVQQIIVITQSSLYADTAAIIATALIGSYVVQTLRQAIATSHIQLLKSREQNLSEVDANRTELLALQDNLVQSQQTEEILRSMIGVSDARHLIQNTADQIKAAFNLYYVGVFLIDAAHEYAVLNYGTGEAGQRMVANKHRLTVGGYSMIGWTTQNHQARTALDVGDEAVHFDNPELPLTRSELSIPIQTSNGILGAMSIQSSQPNAFSTRDVELYQRLADALALALEKAEALARAQNTLEEATFDNQKLIQKDWEEALAGSRKLHFDYENSEVADPQMPTLPVKVPLLLRNEVIGSITLEVEGGELEADQLKFVEAVASQAVSALESTRQNEHTQQAAARERKLNLISHRFSSAASMDELLQTAVTEFGQLPDVSEASISMIAPEDYEALEINSGEPEVRP
jgi:GAF domain-containing protein